MTTIIGLFIFIYLHIVIGQNTYEPTEKQTELSYSKYQLRGMYKHINFMEFSERLIKLEIENIKVHVLEKAQKGKNSLRFRVLCPETFTKNYEYYGNDENNALYSILGIKCYRIKSHDEFTLIPIPHEIFNEIVSDKKLFHKIINELKSYFPDSNITISKVMHSPCKDKDYTLFW